MTERGQATESWVEVGGIGTSATPTRRANALEVTVVATHTVLKSNLRSLRTLRGLMCMVEGERGRWSWRGGGDTVGRRG